MNYSDRIEAVITLFEKGFTGAQVRELLNIPEPTLYLPGRNNPDQDAAPTTVVDADGDPWNRNDDGTWDMEGASNPVYRNVDWRFLVQNYGPLEDSLGNHVPSDAWPA